MRRHCALANEERKRYPELGLLPLGPRFSIEDSEGQKNEHERLYAEYNINLDSPRGNNLVGARRHVYDHYERIGNYSPPLSHIIERGYIGRSGMPQQMRSTDESSIGSQHVDPLSHHGYIAENPAAPMIASSGSRRDDLTLDMEQRVRARATARPDEEMLPLESEQSGPDAGNSDSEPSAYPLGLKGSNDEVSEFEGDFLNGTGEPVFDHGNEASPFESNLHSSGSSDGRGGSSADFRHHTVDFETHYLGSPAFDRENSEVSFDGLEDGSRSGDEDVIVGGESEASGSTDDGKANWRMNSMVRFMDWSTKARKWILLGVTCALPGTVMKQILQNISTPYSAWATVKENLRKYSRLRTIKFPCCRKHVILRYIPASPDGKPELEQCPECHRRRESPVIDFFEYIAFKPRLRH